jgi:transcriptional regulator with XRE-family HTH domain
MGKVKNKRLKHAPHYQLKGFLVANNIRQHEVAEMLNISPVTLNQKLNGYLHFTFDEVEKICEEYDLKPDIFLTQKVAR